MNLIHRHIFANVLLTCAASIGLLGFVLMIGNALKDLLPFVLSGQIEVGMFFHLIWLMIPFVVYHALAPGMLTGILLVLGRMSSDREITALRSSGVSVAWLSAPIIFLGLSGVVIGLLVNFYLMPVTRLAYQREKVEAIRQSPVSFIVPKTFIREFPGIVLFVGEKKNNQFKDFWLWELDAKNRVKRFVRADTGRLDYDEKNKKLVLTLEHAQAELRSEKDPENFAQKPATPAMELATFDLPLSKITGDNIVEKRLKWFTFPELITRWAHLKLPDPNVSKIEQSKQLMQVQITIQGKFAAAFSVLSFVLIGIPLGIKVSRKETSANLVLGLILALGYYFATVMAGLFDNYPALRPDLIVWLPNIVFQGVGLWLFYKVDRA